MTSFTTFYLSRVIGKKVMDSNGKTIGTLKDILIESNHDSGNTLVIGVKLKLSNSKESKLFSFDTFVINKTKDKISVKCNNPHELSEEVSQTGLFLVDVILDKQIVDLNGRKLVRVNDIRLVSLTNGTYVLAVDIGMEGLLRRIGIALPIKRMFNLVKLQIPAKLILWEDVEAIDFSNLNIKLSKTYSKLQTLHPSDLADIIEDLGKKSMTEVFSALD